jgi:excisionase family DNA binding protein
MIYGYLRVSTDKQDTENQKLSVNAKAEQLKVVVDKWILDDGISGLKEPKDRKLGWLLKKVKKNDTIIISELSRFGRSTYMVMRILEELSKNEVLVYSYKDNFYLDNSITSKMQAFVFSIAAEIERDMISKRTKEALKRRVICGQPLGRPIGTKSKKKKLDKHEDKIIEYLNKGLSYSSIARLLNVHRLTVAKLVEDNGLTKYRKGYQSYLALREKNVKNGQMKIKNSQTQLCSQLLNDEIVSLYVESNYSMTKLSAKLSMSKHQCRKFVEKRGLWDKFIEVNNTQRNKIKKQKELESTELEKS